MDTWEENTLMKKMDMLTPFQEESIRDIDQIMYFTDENKDTRAYLKETNNLMDTYWHLFPGNNQNNFFPSSGTY